MRARFMILLLAATALAGCAAITSTTNTTARTLDATFKATTQSSESTTAGDEESSEYAKARQFVDSQFVLIRREAAAGGGEHTAALARLMGVSNVAAFDDWLQSNYQPLFGNLSEHAELVTRIANWRGNIASTGAQPGA